MLTFFQAVYCVNFWLAIPCFLVKMKVWIIVWQFKLIQIYFSGDQLSCIIELLGMPPQKLLDQSKRAKNFISSKGISYKYIRHHQLLMSRLPSLLHSHNPSGWNHSLEWRQKQERKAQRATRVQRASNCIERLWWSSLSGFYSQVWDLLVNGNVLISMKKSPTWYIWQLVYVPWINIDDD